MNLHEEGRVLYISMADVSKPNGPGVNEREFMVALLRKFGQRVHVLIPRPLYACSDIASSQTTFYPRVQKWNPIGFLYQQLRLQSMIRRLLTRQHSDFVVTRLGILPAGIYLALARRPRVQYAVKTLGEVQGFAMTGGLKSLFAKSLRIPNLWLHREITKRALVVDACTEPLLQQHRLAFGLPDARLLLVENATNVEKFAPNDPARARSDLGIPQLDPILGYVGGRPDERGGMEILELLARLRSDFPRIGAVIVGGAERRLPAIAQQLGVEDRTIIPGQVPYEQIPDYVNSFDICFAIDRPERFRRVGNSYQKVRQYLACGKRVVTCVPDDSFIRKENLGECVDADNLDSIEAATRKLLAMDEDAIGRYRSRAVTYARNHLSTDAALNHRIDCWSTCLND